MMKETEIIGKVSATEKNPSTFETFYFWTKAGYQLSPSDVVMVKHINDSITYGIIDEISHVTDSASHFASFISSDFGSTEEEMKGNTDRITFNYVKAHVLSNTKNIWTPVIHGSLVSLCDPEHIQKALGLDDANVKNPLTCGYLEMYGNRVPVKISTDFLVGPDGAHLNISGISGLACKTSYTMFLMNALQQKYEKEAKEKKEVGERPEKVGYIMFNVKGRDLLSINEPAHQVPDKDIELYKSLGLEVKPFSNVHFYYPYSNNDEMHNIQSFADYETMYKKQKLHNDASVYKYDFRNCRDKFSYLFANEEDASGTMESIISWIENENAPFCGITSWKHFDDRLAQVLNPDSTDNPARKNIPLVSWKKFNRIIDKIKSDSVFSDGVGDDYDAVSLSDSIKNIKAGEVKVVDIARLNERSQAFVFGDVIGTIIEMMNTKVGEDALDKIVIFVDELNKYASKDCPKSSPILRHLLDITERGRSLGIILFAVEQFRSAIHDRIKGNCATTAYGRSNFVEVSTPDYRFLGDSSRNLVTRLTPGEYVIVNPALQAPIKIKFPRPTYKQNS